MKRKLRTRGIIKSILLVHLYWSAHNAQLREMNKEEREKVPYKHLTIKQSYKDLREGYS
jgi:hypothetical protein